MIVWRNVDGTSMFVGRGSGPALGVVVPSAGSRFGWSVFESVAVYRAGGAVSSAGSESSAEEAMRVAGVFVDLCSGVATAADRAAVARAAVARAGSADRVRGAA